MSEILEFLIRHGYVVLFAAVWLEQTGFPVPAVPVLLGIGALAGEGRFSIPLALLLATAASLLADAVWYELGRRRGFGVLRVICRISLNTDSCVNRTQDIFMRYGPRALLVAKFLPGLSTVAPPMAGLLRMSPARFALLDGAGALLWAGAYCLLGYAFRHQIEGVALFVSHMGVWFLIAAGAAATLYLVWKSYQRQVYLRDLRMNRVFPEDLQKRLLNGEQIAVVDLRHSAEFLREGAKIPGAIHIPPEDLDNRHMEIPRDRDVVAYCT
ncbi:MAG: VTT domain-containing protein [Bryobacteraceae bacterium]